MATFIEKLFKFNLWANTEIIQLCATLDETQLAVEASGVYGRIKPTITHIVRSEGTYLGDLGGEYLWDHKKDWGDLSFAQLLEMAQQSGSALLERAASMDPDMLCEFVADNKRYEFPAWTIANQAINHGIEHRTQLRLLLTQLGVPHPGQSVWGFSESIGALQVHDVSGE
jgi:uncharacterized damage-inducible protein DinB